jgi:hypothetical protein
VQSSLGGDRDVALHHAIRSPKVIHLTDSFDPYKKLDLLPTKGYFLGGRSLAPSEPPDSTQ